MYAVDFNWRMVNDGTAAGSYFRWNRNSEHTGNQIIASDSNITMRSKTALQGTYRGIFVDSVGQLGIDLPTSSSSKTYKLLLRNQSDRMVYESNYSLSDLPQIQQSRVSSQFDKTNETLADITGLTANVAAGKTYRFEAKLYTTSSSSGGIKVAIAGTATATAIVYEGLTTNAGLITQSRSVALAGAVGGVTAVTASYVVITGTITVNAAGTLTVQSARNAASGTTSILVGSTFEITEIL